MNKKLFTVKEMAKRIVKENISASDKINISGDERGECKRIKCIFNDGMPYDLRPHVVMVDYKLNLDPGRLFNPDATTGWHSSYEPGYDENVSGTSTLRELSSEIMAYYRVDLLSHEMNEILIGFNDGFKTMKLKGEAIGTVTFNRIMTHEEAIELSDEYSRYTDNPKILECD